MLFSVATLIVTPIPIVIIATALISAVCAIVRAEPVPPRVKVLLGAAALLGGLTLAAWTSGRLAFRIARANPAVNWGWAVGISLFLTTVVTFYCTVLVMVNFLGIPLLS
jgi:hypothetical protein